VLLVDKRDDRYLNQLPAPGVGCRPWDAGLWLCHADRQNDLLNHLFDIPDLDLSEVTPPETAEESPFDF
jgi:hypothetical protein